jgi:glycine dehydrogenase subunit 2
MLGKEGLERVSENAVLNANYIQEKLKNYYDLPYPGTCKHECVFSASRQIQQNGIHAIDIAKALIDEGYHPPTIYFPSIVKEALMIEPTETESKETIDEFIDAMIKIAKMAESSPEKFKDFPQKTPVGRLDETTAVKNLNVNYIR